MAIIYVALGSNVGNREERVLQAVDQMKTFATVNKVSTLMETEAQGPNQGQPNFINAVVELETTSTPEEVFFELLKIEENLGRNTGKKGKNKPREIDLDLIVYGSEVVKTDRLTIPHPRMTERQFVMAPLAQLNPTWIHPETGESIQTTLKKFL